METDGCRNTLQTSKSGERGPRSKAHIETLQHVVAAALGIILAIIKDPAHVFCM